MAKPRRDGQDSGYTLKAVEEQLVWSYSASPALLVPQKHRLRLVATDGAFSMDGDVAPLQEICRLAAQYGALVFVDECHATGFLGPTGRWEHLRPGWGLLEVRGEPGGGQ